MQESLGMRGVNSPDGWSQVGLEAGEKGFEMTGLCWEPFIEETEVV